MVRGSDRTPGGAAWLPAVSGRRAGLCVTAAREGAVRGGGLRAAGLAVGRLVSNVLAVVVGTGLIG